MTLAGAPKNLQTILTIMAVFILETDYPSGRTWASLFSASDNSSRYKYGHEDELSVQTELSPLCVCEDV